MPAKDAELKIIYDKLDNIEKQSAAGLARIEKQSAEGFAKIEKDIEKLECQGNNQAERSVKIETQFNSHVLEYREFKSENDKIHNDLFGKTRAICEKDIPQQIKNAQSGIYLKIIGVVFATLIPLVGIGLGILGMILK